MKKITINGKEFPIKKIDFNAMVELEEKGLDIDSIGKKGMSTLRALVAWVMDCEPEKAGKEINDHLMNGGNFDNFTVLMEAFNESDFFKSLQTTK